MMPTPPENEPTFPVFGTETAPAVLKEWDPILQRLWGPPERAGDAAARLYCERHAATALRDRPAAAAARFAAALARSPIPPVSPEYRYRAVVIAAWSVLRGVRADRAQPFLDDGLAAALAPARLLHAGAFTAEVCACLYDYHRGAWSALLTRAQRERIETSLAETFCAFPPGEVDVFWTNLNGSSDLMRGAMEMGLAWLTSGHAVAHLLHGLERSPAPGVRAAIVDALARIGDAGALPGLYALRRTAAVTDWPLARRVIAAIHVIEHLNRGRSARLLLRAAEPPVSEAAALLRAGAESGSAALLRPADRRPPA